MTTQLAHPLGTISFASLYADGDYVPPSRSSGSPATARSNHYGSRRATSAPRKSRPRWYPRAVISSTASRASRRSESSTTSRSASRSAASRGRVSSSRASSFMAMRWPVRATGMTSPVSIWRNPYRGHQPDRGEPTGTVVLDRREHLISARHHRPSERLGSRIILDRYCDVDIPGEPWFGAHRHRQAAHECPAHLSMPQIGIQPMERRAETHPKRRDGMPTPSPCAPPGRRRSHASTAASISSSVWSGRSRRSRWR